MDKYYAAEMLRPDNAIKNILNLTFLPWFIAPGKAAFKEEFFNGNEKCVRYRLLDMVTGTAEPLFDHDLLCSLLGFPDSDSGQLCLTPLSLQNGILRFQCMQTYYAFDGAQLRIEGRAVHPGFLLSPDGTRGVFSRDGNIFVEEISTGSVRQLTFDGEPLYGYADVAQGDGRYLQNKLHGTIPTLGALWSPDGTKLLTYRYDQRRVPPMYLIQSVPETGVCPVLHTYRYPLPGCEHLATADFYVIDIDRGTVRKINEEPVVSGFLQPIGPYIQMAGWSIEGNHILYYSMDRHCKTIRVYIADANTDAPPRLLFSETTDTFLFFDYLRIYNQLAGEHQNPANRQFWCSESLGKLFWLSQRDGFFHVYSYDLKHPGEYRQLTHGRFEVLQILHLDVRLQSLYLMIAGQNTDSNPYDAYPYRLDLGSGELCCLASAKGHHKVYFSPDGVGFLASVSTMSLPQQTWLYRADGQPLSFVSCADISRLRQYGLADPLPFTAPASDGVEQLFGMMILPAGFNAAVKYPLVEYYYGGVQTQVTPRTFAAMLQCGYLQSLARLGFVVMVVDGRGTPGRGKAFHDACYQNLGQCAGIDDHEAVIRYLCKQYSFIDRERIGVWGHSGGGYAALHCLVDKPHLYKAAVSAAGNHLQELYLAEWSERFMGPYDDRLWKEQSVLNRMENLKGKLLLIHGELDENVHPAHTMRVVDALIKQDKDFEMLILPNRHHTLESPFYYRKVVSFLLNALSDAENL